MAGAVAICGAWISHEHCVSLSRESRGGFASRGGCRVLPAMASRVGDGNGFDNPAACGESGRGNRIDARILWWEPSERDDGRFQQVLFGIPSCSEFGILNRHLLQDGIFKNAFDTSTYRFNIPNLRVGTLDSLLALNDDMSKENSFVEAVTHKIRRQIEDLEKASSVESGVLVINGILVESYVTRFTQDEAVRVPEE